MCDEVCLAENQRSINQTVDEIKLDRLVEESKAMKGQQIPGQMHCGN